MHFCPIRCHSMILTNYKDSIVISKTMDKCEINLYICEYCETDIGGKSVQKTVKYAMEIVMTDDLTQQVVGTLGAENKPKISKFTFPYVIIDVVRNTFEGTKIKAVEDRIVEWLHRGSDRKKAENKRRERLNLQQ
ncbi:uncharacterized protein LOC112452336 isoform X1 [Temnothorax curvispinosus]|uniref:Uncharacterized protein LOC112452336 isoform X1 n=1 Tax=Temnothorax curvispinosus TaxID=300111 RepID=A0A6J1PFN5_9HYME|nr:uncharacterized protein LOC112452336 isoform X1 [Temnothorax curvispinosus]